MCHQPSCKLLQHLSMAQELISHGIRLILRSISAPDTSLFSTLLICSVASNALRQFDIIVNNSTWNSKPYTPPFLFADSISGTVQGQERYTISLVATKNATLPPILNAMEMYLIKPISETATDPGEGMDLKLQC